MGRKAVREPLPGLTGQFFPFIGATAGIEIRQDRVAQLRHHRAAASDFDRIFNGFRNIPKQINHLVPGLEIVLRGQTPALVVGDHRAFGDADQRIVSFVIFHVEGVRSLGVGGYLGKFFPFGEFRRGIGAGLIGLFVGVIEFLLEFIKPLTLAMRLFGNIYGGEVALGVVTGLLIAIVPIAIYGLELILNVVQALIFSLLTLMFTLLAIEGPHHEEEHASAQEHAARDLADPAYDAAEAIPTT